MTRVLSFDYTAAKRFTSKMDPMPPVAPSPESKLAWFMAGCSKHNLTLDLIEVNSCLKQAQHKAGPASNGLRQKDSIQLHLNSSAHSYFCSMF